MHSALVHRHSRPLLPGLHVTPSRPQNVLTTSSARRLRLCGSKEEEGHTLGEVHACMHASQERCKGSGMATQQFGLLLEIPVCQHGHTSMIVSRSRANCSYDGSPGLGGFITIACG